MIIERIDTNDTFMVNGKRAFAAKNPSECYNFNHLTGHEVEINGNIEKIYSVERYVHIPPWRQGESICIVLENKTAHVQ